MQTTSRRSLRSFAAARPAAPSQVPTASRRRRSSTNEKATIDAPDDGGAALERSSTSRRLSKQERFERAMKAFKPPRQWKATFDCIQQQRTKLNNAPVDQMGCHMLGDAEESPEVFRWQVLVGLMLSSQTKDEVTAAAVAKLKADIPGGCTIDALIRAGEKPIDEAICKVGFHTRKAGFLVQTAKMCRDDFGGDIPRTLEGLVSLPGVGPKMAHLALLVAWDDCRGIGVDVHVHRIADRLGWVPSNRKLISTPEDTRKALEWWLPKDPYWSQINHMLVGFGQTVCTPINPKCDECEANTLCPTAFNRAETKAAKPPDYPGRQSHPACKDASSLTEDVEDLFEERVSNRGAQKMSLREASGRDASQSERAKKRAKV